MFRYMKDNCGIMNFTDASSTRAVRLFEAFASVGAPQTLSEISQLLNTPLSTCHGLVKALQDGGYLYANKSSRQHYPTRRLLQIAETIAANDPVVKYFDRHMVTLRDITAETVILGALQKDAVVYLNVVESPNSIRYSARPGDIKPLHSSALGKLMLGEASAHEREVLIGSLSLKAVTENTLTDADALRRDLNAARDAGFYVTQGENVSEVMAIAAPARIAGETYGIAVAGPIERMQRKREMIEKALRETCAGVGGDFG
jgi:DNA-binding IclR family transcriptional regulator